MSNIPDALRAWAGDLIAESTLDATQRKVAVAIATAEIQAGGLRGAISSKLLEAGFTNEQFNFGLYS